MGTSVDHPKYVVLQETTYVEWISDRPTVHYIIGTPGHMPSDLQHRGCISVANPILQGLKLVKAIHVT